MKKRNLIVLLLCAVLLLTCGCSAKAKTFTASGMTIELTEDFTEKDMLGFTAVYQSEDVFVFALKEEFDILGDEMNVDEYAELVLEANQMDAEVKHDNGHTYFTFDKTVSHHTLYVDIRIVHRPADGDITGKSTVNARIGKTEYRKERTQMTAFRYELTVHFLRFVESHDTVESVLSIAFAEREFGNGKDFVAYRDISFDIFEDRSVKIKSVRTHRAFEHRRVERAFEFSVERRSAEDGIRHIEIESFDLDIDGTNAKVDISRRRDITLELDFRIERRDTHIFDMEAFFIERIFPAAACNEETAKTTVAERIFPAEYRLIERTRYMKLVIKITRQLRIHIDPARECFGTYFFRINI